jgi:hypothetical protein
LFARRDADGPAGAGNGVSGRDDEWLQPWLELSPDDWF